jgi:Ca2+-binding EF-hand superfamily protein
MIAKDTKQNEEEQAKKGVPNNAFKEQVTKIMLNAFKRLDADRSGFLEKHELEDVMRKITKGLGVEEPSNEDVDFIMK